MANLIYIGIENAMVLHLTQRRFFEKKMCRNNFDNLIVGGKFIPQLLRYLAEQNRWKKRRKNTYINSAASLDWLF